MDSINGDVFPLGVVAIDALRRHYIEEIMPYTVCKGISNAAIREAAHTALDRLLDEIWPDDDGGDTLASVFAELARRQEPLGADFERAIEADREGLYEP